MKKAYFLSGLGADHRLFKKQIENNLSFEILPWLKPQYNESLESYCKRMVQQIPNEEEPIILGGVSFGGMIALEMSKYIPTHKIILISSVKSHKEIPFQIRIWRTIPIYKLLGGSILKKAGILFRYLFGRMPKEEKTVFLQMVKDSDSYFIQWSANIICNWRNDYLHQNIIHLHGTSDLIFPIKNILQPVISISKGTHLMIMTSYLEINGIIKKELEQTY